MDHCEQKKRKRNPRETANIFSLLSFAYTVSLFKKAYKNNDLEEDDLYDVLKACSSAKCGDKLERQWIIENKAKKERNPSIYRLMWARFGKRYILIGCIHLCWKIFNSIVDPWALSKLVSFFKPGQTAITKNEAYYYAALVLILHLVYTIYIHNYVIWVQQLGVEVKTAFSSLLYRKALKLTPSSVSEITLGNIVTLITKDVYSFQQSVWIVNDLWIAIVQTCVICFLLYAKIGVISFVGIGVILSVLPLQILLGRYVSILRLSAEKKTDQRLQTIQETLSSIRIIKMYKWEEYFREKINQSRLAEINRMLLAFYLKIVIVILGVLFSKVGFYVLIISCIWMGYPIEAELVFYLLSIFKDLKHSLGVIIPYGIGRGAELYSAIIRINKVIKGEELPPKIGSDAPTASPVIEVKDATVHIKDKCILKDVTLSINSSSLLLVTGKVGSGKSSLLKMLLQDYPVTDGHLLTFGRISYASQDPWLFPSSIKQNILFGEKYNETRYKEVIKVCALEYDLSLFEKGDETIVTDKGLNLSKGQQARVNLARAIYKESEIYLLDDSLTALDAHVQDYIFNECIKSYLKDKICILVSQTANHIQEADIVIIMNEGLIKYNGKPTEKVIKQIEEIVVEDDDLEKEVLEENEPKMNGDAKQKQLFETEQNGVKANVYSEVNKKGEVDFDVYKKYFKFGGGFLLITLNVVLFGLAQGTDSYADKLLTKWVDEKQVVLDIQKNITELNLASSQQTEDLIEAEATEKFTIRLYSIMILATTLLALLKSYTIFDFCRRASINIHKAMVTCITYAVMAFFDTHFIGNVLNRFSQDMTNIDEHILNIFSECIRVTFAVAGIVFLISFVNPYFLIFALVFFSSLILIRKLYLPAGRSLKRLEAATRSPMIGHLNASLEGLTTIRAYKAQGILTREYDRHQDVFTSAHYTALCSMRAFGFIMDFLCSIFIILVVFTFIFFDTGTSAGNVGLTLTQIFMLAGLVQWGVRTWADLENLMTSVERLLEYTEIPSEPKEGSEMENWPKQGAIVYENVSLTYNNSETVLKNLNFKVEPNEKIGICGRTGAGKSSIISTIFRLYEPEGKIIIDGVNIQTLSLTFLRKKLAIIPQDPILFTGTIRSNLDPMNEFKDEELWKVIEEVNMKELVPSLGVKITNSGGSNFSSGEKQLICLARAILRKTKIIVLDEATANMDHETDILLHNTIKRNFTGCTLLTIAHRLHSILECDKVMVLDKGQIKEFDTPMNLLKNSAGIFYKMVEQAGLLNHLKTE
ncbi:ATP-binding cassette sub-family C member 4-like isoform X1 [Diabrotica virgifera virgifera]|uniref:Multidrug resistance-associated protein lethal(2)03659 n=1 Tax=Diabrotica virgifera virgifera TaxID=50390 RepID=A0ABM5JQ00_DIAVI|nr:ATP-binding cassette sub-family C member 4-like isoform X1 [Diabrotica virgifera virgifera]XP_050500015.1 ATP-binding cassette sub-family C member 4-like isoform X1 [Diabrotica virgifera virgifera]